MLRPTPEEAIIRQRMIDIVLSIRPMPLGIRPSDKFIRDTRAMLLGKSSNPSLIAYRRERTLARLEDFTKRRRAS
jgi:hypothetical protein